MPGSEDTRTITGYRTASKFYRRPPGLAWLLGLIVVPLVLGLIGWSLHDRSKSHSNLTLPTVAPTAVLTVPSVNAPNTTAVDRVY
jgi:peptidoglycan-binding protein ArfA